jgi:2,4-dienoyl-CoA reductase-like NADH-dependent reductase (Old Yellow Enzyme family)
MIRYKSFEFPKSGKVAPNRIALAPMTNSQSNDDGSLSDDEYNWLIRRAKEGFGIIITCAAHVSLDGQGWKGELGIFNDALLPGLTRLASGIKEHGSLGIVQIYHGGARSPENITGKQPWSAQAHEYKAGENTIRVREGSTNEIEATITHFVEAAKRAEKAGFDGVELHGAHGYLISQFISKSINKRSDQWGGSFENRIRFVRTILTEVKKAVSKNFIVGIRISPEEKGVFLGIDFDESIELAKILAEDGADYIHISPWDSFKHPDKYPNTKTIIEYMREAVPKETPLMVAGEIWSGDDAEKAIHLGSEFIALGKAAIGMPDWPTISKNPNFVPLKPPYTVQHLKESDLGDVFISYMKRWNGFVKND